MTVRDMKMYLDTRRPPILDCAYGLAHKYRITETTARACLTENGYVLTENRWIRHQTQLDRVEEKLDTLLKQATT